MILTLMVEVVYIYGIGMAITIPQNEVRATLSEVQRATVRQWPQVRTEALRKLHPIIERDLYHLVNGVSVSVGGMEIVLPKTLSDQIVRHLTQQIDGQIAYYLSEQVHPRTLITEQNFRRIIGPEISFRLWVDVYKLPIPVTVHVDV